MMDMLKADLTKEITEMEMEEKDAQEEYEELMADASEKRSVDSKSITEKEGALAEMEDELQLNKDVQKGTTKEKHQVMKVMLDLHGECDWLLENYAARKEARANEIDALGKAK